MVLKSQFKRWQHEGRFPGLVSVAGSLYRFPRHARNFCLMPLIARQLRNTAEVRTADAVVEQVFTGFFGALKPLQVREELVEMARRVAELRPRRVLEVGTANGATLFTMSRLAADDALIISVDLPGGAFGGGYPRWKRRLYRRFAVRQQSIHLIRGDSHTPEVLAVVREALGGEPLDVAFIDGDHTYEGVRRDYEIYSPLVRPGGLIFFHDIADHGASPCQVRQLWGEIRRDCGPGKTEEFVADEHQGWAGIGMLIKGQ